MISTAAYFNYASLEVHVNCITYWFWAVLTISELQIISTVSYFDYATVKMTDKLQFGWGATISHIHYSLIMEQQFHIYIIVWLGSNHFTYALQFDQGVTISHILHSLVKEQPFHIYWIVWLRSNHFTYTAQLVRKQPFDSNGNR